MKKALVEVSVLLVFFTRHEQFSKVFQQVKEARPSELFLYQDGAREGRSDDEANIQKCRDIALDIDWDCKVHTLFQVENFGCDPSGYIAQTWAFSKTDKCIVIEDDDVPSVSFFYFCKELLEKYEDDKRITMITGLNVDGITNYCPYSYFFSSTSFTVGCWASWKRVVNGWDKEYSFLNDEYSLRLLKLKIAEQKFSPGFINSCRVHHESGIEHFETIMISNQLLRSGMTIIPKKNMVQNIGLTGEATHTTTSLECLPKGYRKIFELEKYEIKNNILSPTKVIEDYGYKKRAYRIYGWGHPLVKFYRFIESSIYMLLKGDFSTVKQEIKAKSDKVRNRTIS